MTRPFRALPSPCLPCLLTQSSVARNRAPQFTAKTEGKVGLLVGKYDDFNGAGIVRVTRLNAHHRRPLLYSSCSLSRAQVFPDGNKWTKVAGGTPSRRPPAVTLNSGD